MGGRQAECQPPRTDGSLVGPSIALETRGVARGGRSAGRARRRGAASPAGPPGNLGGPAGVVGLRVCPPVPAALGSPAIPFDLTTIPELPMPQTAPVKTSVVERFLRYVLVDTQSSENSKTYPSTL